MVLFFFLTLLITAFFFPIFVRKQKVWSFIFKPIFSARTKIICFCSFMVTQVSLLGTASSLFVINLVRGIKSGGKYDAVRAIIECQLMCTFGRGGRSFPPASYPWDIMPELLLGILGSALQMKACSLVQFVFHLWQTAAVPLHHVYNRARCLTNNFFATVLQPSVAEHNHRCLFQF